MIYYKQADKRPVIYHFMYIIFQVDVVSANLPPAMNNEDKTEHPHPQTIISLMYLGIIKTQNSLLPFLRSKIPKNIVK